MSSPSSKKVKLSGARLSAAQNFKIEATLERVMSERAVTLKKVKDDDLVKVVAAYESIKETLRRDLEGKVITSQDNSKVTKKSAPKKAAAPKNGV